MERIKQTQAIQPGDFIYYKGELIVVQSVEMTDQTIIIKTDKETVIEEHVGSRLEVFRMKSR